MSWPSPGTPLLPSAMQHPLDSAFTTNSTNLVPRPTLCEGREIWSMTTQKLGKGKNPDVCRSFIVWMILRQTAGFSCHVICWTDYALILINQSEFYERAWLTINSTQLLTQIKIHQTPYPSVGTRLKLHPTKMIIICDKTCILTWSGGGNFLVYIFISPRKVS